MPFLGILDPFQTLPQGWFYINPSRRGPVPLRESFFAVWAGNPHFGGFWPNFPIFGDLAGSGPKGPFSDPGARRGLDQPGPGTGPRPGDPSGVRDSGAGAGV